MVLALPGPELSGFAPLLLQSCCDGLPHRRPQTGTPGIRETQTGSQNKPFLLIDYLGVFALVRREKLVITRLLLQALWFFVF